MTVLGAEPHLPYDRPPLSKQVLSGQWEPERACLRSALSDVDAEFILGDRRPAWAPPHTPSTESGRALRADTIVVANGVRPRMLPGEATVDGVHVLRTLDDALGLRAARRTRGPLATRHGVAGLTRRRGRVAGVRLDTGEELPADVVAVAIELLR